MRASRTRALGCALLLGSFTGPAFALDDGAIVVVERDGTAPGAPGALFIVDRATGLRTLLSDFGKGAFSLVSELGWVLILSAVA